MQEKIYRHWFGALWRGFIGAAAMSALLFLVWTGGFGDALLDAGALAAVIIIGLVTIVVVYTYSLAHLTLNDSGISVTNYSTLFASVEAEADWNTVQSVTVNQGGIFAKLTGYGTLIVQTADAQPNLVMTYVPTPQQWAQYIDSKAQLGSQVGSGN